MSEGSVPRDPSVWQTIGKEPRGRPQETETLPYSSLDVALDGWTYRIFSEWLGKDTDEQKRNADLLEDMLKEFDPSASVVPEKSKTNPGYSYVFRFGLFGDPGKVTDAIEKLDTQFLNIAGNWEVQKGTAKALLTRTDDSEEAYELPSDMLASDLATTLYRLIDLVQTGDGELAPETESKTSELRQITSPDSGEYCSVHQKTGEEHTDEEREEDIMGMKEEDTWHPDMSYLQSPMGVSVALTD